MKKGKILIVITLFLLIVSLPLGILLFKQKGGLKIKAQSENKPENIQIVKISEQEATIIWTTKTPSQGFINYGLSPTNLPLIQPEANSTLNHQVNLTNLLPETKYFFVIKIGENTFDNNGQPYSFTTKSKKEENNNSSTSTATPSQVKKPTIDEEKMKEAMGTNDKQYDLNKDGIVNALDLLLLRENK